MRLHARLIGILAAGLTAQAYSGIPDNPREVRRVPGDSQDIVLSGGQRRRTRSIERENYWLMATPLKPATPIGLDVAATVRSP
jgi:hypothetical protein